MTEIFAHGLNVRPNEEATGVYDIRGFGWENDPFTIHLTEDMVKDLLWQLAFFIN